MELDKLTKEVKELAEATNSFKSEKAQEMALNFLLPFLSRNVQEPRNKINEARIAFIIIYILIGAFFIVWRYEYIFEFNRSGWPLSLDKFLWCFSSSCFGFAALVSKTIYKQKSVLPSYVTYYPVILIVISALVFSIIFSIPFFKGSSFYYLAFAACFILGFLVDSFWLIITSVVNKYAGSL